MSDLEHATDAMDMESSARASESPQETTAPISRTAAGLSRQISALQRTIESLEKQLSRALARGEQKDAASLARLIQSVKERKALHQQLYDIEVLRK